MRFVVNITSESLGGLPDGNFRGEPRWERNVADALLSGGKTVGCTRSNVASIASSSKQWVGFVANPSKDLVITHSSTETSHHYAGGKYYIYNFFSKPHISRPIDEIKGVLGKIGSSSVVVTQSFRSSSEFRFMKDTFQDNFRWLGTPAVPVVYSDRSNFSCPALTWSSRMIASEIVNNSASARSLFEWIASKMALRSDLILEIITGYQDDYIYDIGKSVDIEKWLWSRTEFSPLESFRDRVVIHKSIPWASVLQILSRTKMIISPPKSYGGPPLEAASFGIPTIGLKNESSFHDETGSPMIKNYLWTHGIVDPLFIEKLDRIYSDKTFYEEAGSEYRACTDQYYSYKAFNTQLDSIITERGWN